MRRAEAVKDYLVSKGIEKNRVYTEGKGEKQPVADNKTAEGRAKNRRVEIEVVGTRAAPLIDDPQGSLKANPASAGFFFWAAPRITICTGRVGAGGTVIRGRMGNADPQELAKFSELAHRWWDPTASSGRCTRSIRCAWTGSTRWPACRASAVLDVGCGGGILAEAMARRAAPACSASTWPPSRWGWRSCTRWKPASTNIDYREVAAEALAAERPAAFDVVTCMEMLEHVPDPASVVQRLRRAGQARRLGVLLDPQPQPEGLPVRASSVPSTC